MVQIIGGHHLRIDRSKGGSLVHLQEVTHHMVELGATEKGMTGRDRGGARQRRVRGHRLLVMPETSVMTSGREVQGPA